MDLFEKIDQFEKIANELADQLEEGMAEDAEIVEENSVQHLERRNSAKSRMKKLAAFLKR